MSQGLIGLVDEPLERGARRGEPSRPPVTTRRWSLEPIDEVGQPRGLVRRAVSSGRKSAHCRRRNRRRCRAAELVGEPLPDAVSSTARTRTSAPPQVPARSPEGARDTSGEPAGATRQGGAAAARRAAGRPPAGRRAPPRAPSHSFCTRSTSSRGSPTSTRSRRRRPQPGEPIIHRAASGEEHQGNAAGVGPALELARRGEPVLIGHLHVEQHGRRPGAQRLASTSVPRDTTTTSKPER